jgi:hypothetical protein
MILRYATSCFLYFPVTLFLTGFGLGQEAPAPEKKKEGAMVRIVCVQNLFGKEERITLAKQSEDGKWSEFGDLEIRPALITDWTQVSVGLNHLVRKDGTKPTSIGSFTISPAMKNAILILLPDMKKKEYRVQLIDPAKLEFRKGKALIVNYSSVTALVNMGKQSKTVDPGKQLVETITTDADGMHPMLIGYQDEEKKTVLCFDRRMSSNPETRTFILLFPAPDNALRAMTLPEFGPFE